MTCRARHRCTNTRPPLLVQALLSGAMVLYWPLSATGQEVEPTDVVTSAQSRSAAEEFAASAMAAYRSGDHELAIELYQLAHEQAPSADILFNLARIYDWALNDREKAMQLYQQAATEPGVKPERIVKARLRLVELRAAERRQKREKARRTAEAEAEAARTMATISVVSSKVRDESKGPDRGLVWALAAGSISVASVGAVYGLSALAKARRARSLCEGNSCESSVGVQAVQDASRHGNVATGALLTSGLFLGVASWLYFRENSGPKLGSASKVQLAADVGSANFALHLRGTW